jgi:PAS domain S-box-containing protein
MSSRREAETARGQVESILSSISDGFFVLDRNWHFTYVNDRLCSMTFKQREELLGYNHWDLFPNTVDTDVYVQFHRAMSSQTPVQFEYLYLPCNRWFQYRVFPSADGLTIFATDITDRKQAELVQAEQKRLLELTASGHALEECLSSLCASVSKLNPRTRACILVADAQRLTFPYSIAPDFGPSFAQGLKDTPINQLAFGTCARQCIPANLSPVPTSPTTIAGRKMARLMRGSRRAGVSFRAHTGGRQPAHRVCDAVLRRGADADRLGVPTVRLRYPSRQHGI